MFAPSLFGENSKINYEETQFEIKYVRTVM